MSLMGSLNVSASGMSAQRTRMDIISQNIANVNTTRDENGDVYRRQTVVFAEKNDCNFESILTAMQTGVSRKTDPLGDGVKITGIAEDHVTPMKMVYDPAHPDADEDGYVTMPNVNTVTEMTNLIDATRSFEANVTAFNATKNMALKGLEIGK
ncbi:MAG: flagellar basal body rod protein FlgC [Lachnospiraceae bacterium]|nr:flagellar basal body rod protein FlgC [Lachnospiraceae bacterium]MBQ8548910.1 flagellar basal body rod protein FlgC [Lachnospiraceae bacterium]